MRRIDLDEVRRRRREVNQMLNELRGMIWASWQIPCDRVVPNHMVHMHELFRRLQCHHLAGVFNQLENIAAEQEEGK